MEASNDVRNKDPEVLVDAMSGLLVNYGWYILIALVTIYFLWQQSLREKVAQLQERREEASISPDEIEKRDEALRHARLRMQERFNEVASVELARQKEKQEKLDEEKRSKKIEEWERHQRGQGYFSKTRIANEEPANGSKPIKSRSEKDSNTFRNTDYNPLTGQGSGGSSGGSSGWRPDRRGGRSGGG